jgi:hypothetical protein
MVLVTTGCLWLGDFGGAGRAHAAVNDPIVCSTDIIEDFNRYVESSQVTLTLDHHLDSCYFDQLSIQDNMSPATLVIGTQWPHLGALWVRHEGQRFVNLKIHNNRILPAGAYHHINSFTTSGGIATITYTDTTDNENRTFNITIAADGHSINALSDITSNTNTAPEITSNGGGATASINIAENQTAVTDAASTDDSDSEGSGLVYTLTGGADQTSFDIVASTGVLTFSSAPDRENPTDNGGNNVYDVQVTVTDSGALTDIQDIAVTVTDIDEIAPTLTTVSIASNNLLDSSLAKSGDTISVSIIADEALAAAPTITIAGVPASISLNGISTSYTATLVVSGSTTIGSAAINISSFTDIAGNPGTTATSVTNGSSVSVDLTSPTLTTVSIASNNVLDSSLAKSGDTISVSIIADEALAAAPTVEIAGETASVTPSGSATSYTAALVVSSSTISSSATINISSFTDSVGNAGTTVTSVTNASAVAVDVTEPTTTITTGGVLGFNESTLTPFTATVTFNETVAGFTDGELTATNASVGTISGTGPYTFLVTPNGGGNVALNVAANVATDGTGNGNTIASTVTVTQTDDIVPTLTITTDSGGSFNQSAPGTFTATVNFNEVVTGFTDGELTATNASLATLSGSGTTYTVVVTPTGTGNVVLSVAGSVAIDGASNNNNAATDVTVIQTDDVAPRISSIERNTPTTQTTDADSLIWRVTFDESVTGVDTSDFSVSGTTATITGVTAESTSIYDVTVSGGDLAELNATVTLAVQSSGSSIIDTLGNIFANSTPTGTNDNTFILSNTIGSTVVVVTSPDNGDIPDGGTDDQGNQQFGIAKTLTYTFTNTGSSPVTLNGASPTVASSSNAGTPVVGGYSTPFTSPIKKAGLSLGFSRYATAQAFTQSALEFLSNSIISSAHATAPSITLQPGESTSFDVTYTPVVAGAFEINLDIPTSAGTFDVAVSGTAVDTIAPTVAIQNAPTSHDNSTSFNITFEFSEDVTGFVVGDITVGNGSASNFVAVDANTYTADITPSGSLNVTIDVAASVAIDSASNGNAAATQVTVKGSIVEDTLRVIADFMSNRANHILSNQSSMIGFVTGSNNGGGGPLGNLQLDSDLDTQTTMSFYTSRSKVLETRAAAQGKGNRLNQSSTDGTSSASSGFASAERFGLVNEETLTDIDPRQANANNQVADGEQLAGQGYKGSDRTGTWDVWTQIHGAQSSQATTKSKYWTANFGSHFFVNNDMLIGLLAQFDWASATDTAASSTVSGNGYMIGPYIAGKVKDQALYYEARALWGQSSNNVSPIGTYTDSFKTARWLTSLKVEGSYDLGDVKIKPGVSLSYFEETQNAYTDTNANLIPAQTISLGEFKFGPSITRSFDVGNGFTMRTNMGVSGIINFGVNNANTSTSNAFAKEEVRARVDAGFELENEYGVRFTAAGYYDGIGTSGYESFGGNLGLIVPLN